MSTQRQLIQKIEIGDDCILIYRLGNKINLVLTCKENGDAEINASLDDLKKIITALKTAEQQITSKS